MKCLVTDVKVGRLMPSKPVQLVLASGQLPNEDVTILQTAHVHSNALVNLVTEHGLWTFYVCGQSVAGAESKFTLISTGAPRPLFASSVA